MTKRISLPQLAWHGVKKLEIKLPENWQVEICNMAGYDRPKLKPAEIKAAIGRPINMLPLREYARDKKEAVILFDDMTRVTRAAEIVPHVLAELAKAGIADNRIRFIAASGCHGAMRPGGLREKAGRRRFKAVPGL